MLVVALVSCLCFVHKSTLYICKSNSLEWTRMQHLRKIEVIVTDNQIKTLEYVFL